MPPPDPAPPAASPVGWNLRRLMAREGLTYDDVMQATGLTRRTVQTLLNGSAKPHAQTLRKLATGLGVEVEELILSAEPFEAQFGPGPKSFDASTNPAVAELVANEPALFEGWSHADLAELRSRFGVGGALTPEGARVMAEQMNTRRETLRRARVVLETRDGPLLAEMIDMLFARVRQEK